MDRHDYKIVTAPIQWSEWAKLSAADSASLRATEAAQADHLAATTTRLDTFWNHVHSRIAQHEQEENSKARNAIAAMRVLREKQHETENAQRRRDNDRAVAKLLESSSNSGSLNNALAGSSAASPSRVTNGASHGTSSEQTIDPSSSELSSSSSSIAARNNFMLSRADELREQESSVAARRTRLSLLREMSRQIADTAELHVAMDTDERKKKQFLLAEAEKKQQQLLQKKDDEEEQKRRQTAERKAANEAEEKASVALFEMKRQWRMRLEEDRLRRAADRVAADAEGMQVERDHRFRRVMQSVEQQRRLFESKQAAWVALAEEGQRLKKIKDRKALLELKEVMLRHVAEIDAFCAADA